MSNNVYKVVEITGSSPDSIAEAVRVGVRRANKTLRNLDWVEVTSIRGHIEAGEVEHFQVSRKVGVRLDD